MCVRSGGTGDLQRNVLGVSKYKGFDCMMGGLRADHVIFSDLRINLVEIRYLSL